MFCFCCFRPDPSHLLLESFELQHWDELRGDGLDFGTLTFETGGVLVPLSSVTLAPLPPSGSFVCESPALHWGLEVLLFAPDKRNHFSAVICSGLLLLHFEPHTAPDCSHCGDWIPDQMLSFAQWRSLEIKRWSSVVKGNGPEDRNQPFPFSLVKHVEVKIKRNLVKTKVNNWFSPHQSVYASFTVTTAPLPAISAPLPPSGGWQGNIRHNMGVLF